MRTHRSGQGAGGGRSRGSSAGYSFPELMIVVAIIGLFVLFGGPAMNEAYNAYQVRTYANNLATDIKATRYLAVTNRAPQAVTVNAQNHGSAPNQYSYTNPRGKVMTVRLEGANIESTSAASVPFGINGATGSSGNLTVVLSATINRSRGDRYTISVTPSGTVTSAYTTYAP